LFSGLTLSLSFNFLILYPAMVLVMIGVAVLAHGEGVGAVVLMMIFCASAVQLGYFLGLVMRAVMTSFDSGLTVQSEAVRALHLAKKSRG
jgi:hypothetical protein